MAFFGWIIIIAYEQNRYHDVMRLYFVLMLAACSQNVIALQYNVSVFATCSLLAAFG